MLGSKRDLAYVIKGRSKVITWICESKELFQAVDIKEKALWRWKWYKVWKEFHPPPMALKAKVENQINGHRKRGRKASRSREWSLTNRYEWKGHLSPTTTRKLIHKIWVDFISMEGNMEKVGHLMSVGEAMD